jgi:hypothetical protein
MNIEAISISISDACSAQRRIRRLSGIAFALALSCSAGLSAVQASSAANRNDDPDAGKFCSATAKLAAAACAATTADDLATAVGICINIEDAAERATCLADSRTARRDHEQLCGRQLSARRAVCAAIGEKRYDPDFDPGLFETHFNDQNRYVPLTVGNRWEYGGAESVKIEVLDRIKLIEGVPCIVVRDQVRVQGALVEDTDDWLAQARDGDVYYCGEEVKELETFADDQPPLPELVMIDGSFKTGRDRAKPGIFFRGSPRQGEVYRQEFSFGNAEDIARILSTSYAYGQNPELDRFVPRKLAELLCAGDCIVTRESTPLEPDLVERKYFAPGVGFFLQTKPADGTVVQLVDCNVDSRCHMLPKPSQP